jgi:hypothetical protein
VAAARRGARRPARRGRRRPHALAGGHRGRLPPSQPPGRALRRGLDGEAGRAVRGLRDLRLGRARRQRGRRARHLRRVPHGQPRPAHGRRDPRTGGRPGRRLEWLAAPTAWRPQGEPVVLPDDEIARGAGRFALRPAVPVRRPPGRHPVSGSTSRRLDQNGWASGRARVSPRCCGGGRASRSWRPQACRWA